MVDTKGNEYSSGNFLKTVAPDLYKRSWGRLEDPPDGLLKVGLTSRNRIIKTVQLHLVKPLVTPLTKAITPYYRGLMKDIEAPYRARIDYTGALWATGYDYELATALALEFGPAPGSNLRMEGASMHRLTKTDEGIHLEIDYPFTFQERLIYACQTIYNEVVSKSLSGVRPGVEELVKVGMTNFFYCQGWYCSVPGAYKQVVENYIRVYCGKCIDSIGTQVPFPVIAEPENCVLPYDDTLKWNDFKFSNGLSSKQVKRNLNNNQQSNLETLRKFLADKDPNKEYTSAELKEFGLTKTSITAGSKYGFLQQIGGGRNTRYILQFLKEE